MADVFISYKAEDRRRIQPLVQALQADGYSVWWDEHIGTGDQWRQTIEQQLDSARCVLVIWSKRSVGPDGHFVRDEASRAQRRRVYVPVLIDAVEPPLGFGESQATSLRGWKGDRSDSHYQAVLSAIKRIAGSGTETVGEHPEKASVSRRTAIAGGSAAAAAIAAGGVWALLRRAPASSAKSVAVLPFANLSGDPSQAYFSDGIAEELRTVLARIPRLKVIGRTSSELMRSADAITAARKLAVADIVMGSVRRSPSMVRISAQLVSGKDGAEQWSQVYDRAPGDILVMQSDIAKSIADALQLQLGGATEQRLISGSTNNASARDLYLQAIAVGKQGLTEENLRESIRLFDRAIDADSGFADAYAGKAVALATLTGTFANTAADFERGYAESARIARRAIALAPDRAIGHSALGVALGGILDVPGALAEHERARRLFAGEPEVLSTYSLFMSKVGKPDEGLRAANEPIPIDPLNPGLYAMRSNALWFGHRFSEAASSFRELIKKAHHAGPLAWVGLGNCLMLLGRTDEARKAFSAAQADNVYRMTSGAILLGRTGEAAAAMEALGRLRDRYGDSAAYQQAQILAQLGQADASIAALNRSLEVRDPGLLSMAADPFVDPVRKDARFTALLRKMNFPA